MLESFIETGAQPLGGALRYGCSVTDPCIGWEATADALLHARNRLLARAG
ncbi:Phospho-2-dehydro-3-deoxyheptonate aldolase, Trp-sensitive [Burkholderia lata]|nr:Phospho-2-dehydro-3-deoxyheptonate aldolase, Trp-sensitive [Burkholderia lata]